MKKRPEILAPAGSMESLMAAVYCGANAVYLGAKDFNARRNATNFQAEELEKAVEFCHERDAKVFQTLNILMFAGEENQLLDAVETACKLGVDGVIVQDLGALSIIRKAAPSLKICASTQMAVHNIEGVQQAAALGCRRVVLARELSSAEIGNIVKASPVEIEVFVHGALCMSVSGQCYLSSMLGGRSGNRGLCAQPCRLPFAFDTDTHALSLKDLSLVDRVQELCDMGVTSLKIEGRMKRAEYVAASVTALKMAMDGETPDLVSLQKIFSRSGFTSAYFDGALNRDMFGIRQKEDVVAASDVLTSLSRLATKEQQRVKLQCSFEAVQGQNLLLKVSDNRYNDVCAYGDVPEVAQNKPTDKERIAQSLNKTGSTPYSFENMDISLDDGLAIRVSQINSLRHEALEELALKRRKTKPVKFLRTLPDCPAPVAPLTSPHIVVRCAESQLSSFVAKAADKLVLPLIAIEKAIELGACTDNLIIEIPRIIFDGDRSFDEDLIKAKALGVTTAWCGNIGAIGLAKKHGFEILGGWSLNIANSYAACEIASMGAASCELSFEIPMKQAQSIGQIKKGIVVYGRLPLMAFRSCPIRARIGCERCKGEQHLTDRMSVQFPITCRDHKTSELLNSVPLYLADRMDEFKDFDFVSLWFTTENEENCKNILKEYKMPKTALPPQEGHTRGLYYRQVF